MSNINGIWIGENSVIAAANGLNIAFLRLQKDLIISVLHHGDKGVVGVVYGYGTSEAHDHTSAIVKNGKNESIKNNEEANDFITSHSNDKISYDYDGQNQKLIYTTYDNMIFENELAEEIPEDMSVWDIERENAGNLIEKMAVWNRSVYFEQSDNGLRAGINTRRYSICYNVEWGGITIGEQNLDEFIYCRVGQNGYCEKGWAMLPTLCIRHHQTYYAFEDNLLSIKDYKPNEDWFVADACSFPQDGGWYWSLKEITDDVIYLQGCGGDIYWIRIK